MGLKGTGLEMKLDWIEMDWIGLDSFAEYLRYLVGKQQLDDRIGHDGTGNRQ